MYPPDCPEWEYEDHPDRAAVLPRHCRELLLWLLDNQRKSENAACDTRPSHKQLFEELTPIGYEYYAGNYRGSKYRCLEWYAVTVRDDPRVGLPPGAVAAAMLRCGAQLSEACRMLDEVHALPDHRCGPEYKLVATVRVVCAFLEDFLRVHPYANGNGHAARFAAWAILWRYGYWPRRWPLDERPDYCELLTQYRDGYRDPLQQFVLRCV